MNGDDADLTCRCSQLQVQRMQMMINDNDADLLRRCSDMKLDNTLFDGQKPPFIKICDFGFARAWQDPALYRMSSRVG